MSHTSSNCSATQEIQKRQHDDPPILIQNDAVGIKRQRSTSIDEDSHKSKTDDSTLSDKISPEPNQDMKKSVAINEVFGSDCIQMKNTNPLLQNTGNAHIMYQTLLPCHMTTPAVTGTSMMGTVSLPLQAATMCDINNIQIVSAPVCSISQSPVYIADVCNPTGIRRVNLTHPFSLGTIPMSNSDVTRVVTSICDTLVQAPADNGESKVLLKNLLQAPVVSSVNRETLKNAPSEVLSKEVCISKAQQQTVSAPLCFATNNRILNTQSIKATDCSRDADVVNNVENKLYASASDDPGVHNQDFASDIHSQGQKDGQKEPETFHVRVTDLTELAYSYVEVTLDPNNGMDGLNLIESTQNSDPVTDRCDKGRPKRKSQRRGRSCDTVVCPVCRVAVRQSDITEHLSVETSRLNKWAQEYRRKQSKRHTAESSNVSGGHTSLGSHKDRYQNFLRIKHHRQERGLSSSKRGSGTQCPVCNQRISGTQYQLNQHVEKCLLKDNADIDVEGSSDSEGATEGFEEYEWAGQTRIRASSLLPGSSLAESGFVVGQKSAEDAELDIEEDETEMYGQAQYNEADLIPCVADEPEEESGRQAIRDILLQQASHSTSVQRCSQTSDKWGSGDSSEQDGSQPVSTQSQQNVHTSSQGEEPGISKQQEDKVKPASGDKYRCLICMESYDSPTTSIQCWHVYCEECWLRTLGAKKLCPQCNVITHPSDLRRIYL